MAATRVLSTLYQTEKQNLHTAEEALRRFAETEEERAMAPDELARLIIERELAHLKSQTKTKAAGTN